MALHAAGVRVHSGTVPVERLWASMKDMFPRSSRGMSLAWFNVVAKLAYLRFNYRHFNHNNLPLWTEADSLLAERIENLVLLTKALRLTDETQELFAAFS